jgi:hypothetical protein
VRPAAALLVAAVATGATGCGGGGDQVSDDHAATRLEQQRDGVRGLATDLTGSLGPTSESWGRYEGCDSAFNDVYRNFRYLAQLRLDAAPEGPLDPVLAAAGLTRDDAASEPDKLRATRDDLSVSFWTLPAGGLLVTVQGPCVDVPEDARADWTQRGSREQLA